MKPLMALFMLALCAGCAPTTILACKEHCAARGRLPMQDICALPAGAALRRGDCRCDLPKLAAADQAAAPKWWYSPYGKVCPVFPIKEGIANISENDKQKALCNQHGAECIQRKGYESAWPDCSKLK